MTIKKILEAYRVMRSTSANAQGIFVCAILSPGDRSGSCEGGQKGKNKINRASGARWFAVCAET